MPPRPDFALIPFPHTITPRGGSCDLPPRSRWSGDRDAIGLLEGWLSKSSPKADATLVLAVDKDRSDLDEEGYELTIEKSGIRATARTPAGLVYASQTLRQLAFGAAGTVPCVRIIDRPRFPWRGLMLDSARHFFPVETVLRLLDLASLHKLNRFHWHLTDDQGWRVEIRAWPRLTAIGSARRRSQVRGLPLGENRRPGFIFDDKPHGGFYSQADVRRVVSHARKLGITVVPEIDLPGHMQSAIAAYPQLGNGAAVEVSSAWGVSHHILNVEPETIRFLENVLEEMLELFPGPWIHLGGDEVPGDEWEKSPAAAARARQLGLAGAGELQGWLVQHFAQWLTDRGRVLIGKPRDHDAGEPHVLRLSAVAGPAQHEEGLSVRAPPLGAGPRGGTTYPRKSGAALERVDPGPGHAGSTGIPETVCAFRGVVVSTGSSKLGKIPRPAIPAPSPPGFSWSAVPPGVKRCQA